MDPYLPLKNRERRRLRWRLKIILTLIVVFLIAGGLIYWLFFSSFWQIKEFKIEGLEKISQTDFLNQLKTESSFANNLWLWPRQEIVIGNWPLLASIETSKNFFTRAITIYVQERQAAGVWCAHVNDEQDCYWFDQDGFIFDIAPRPEGGLIATIDDYQDGLKTKLGQNILEKSLWNNFFKLIDSWLIKERIVHNFVIDRQRQELTATTAFNFKLLFSYRFDSNGNLAALQKLRDQGNVNFKKIDYIDLRVENRIYYK